MQIGTTGFHASREALSSGECEFAGVERYSSVVELAGGLWWNSTYFLANTYLPTASLLADVP